MPSNSLLILIVFVCACSANELQTEGNLVEIQNKLFAFDAEPIGVDKTLELLTHLALIYKDGADGIDVTDRSDQVNALIQVSLISADKCDDSSLLKRWSLMEYHSSYTVNIMPYLRHFWIEQFNKCNNVFAGSLRESIKGLDSGLIEFMAQLRESVFKVGNNKELSSALAEPFNFVSKAAYKEAVLAAMERRVGSETKFKQNKITGTASDFANELESTVKEPCRQIRAQLENSSIKNYEIYLYNRDLAARIDPLAQEWIKSLQMCKKIALTSVQLTLEAYQDLLARKQPGFKQKSGLRYFFTRS